MRFENKLKIKCESVIYVCSQQFWIKDNTEKRKVIGTSNIKCRYDEHNKWDDNKIKMRGDIFIAKSRFIKL